MAIAKLNGQIRELPPEEARKLFDRAAQHYLGIPGEEFIRRWKAGEYAQVDDSKVIHLVMLAPFAE